MVSYSIIFAEIVFIILDNIYESQCTRTESPRVRTSPPCKLSIIMIRSIHVYCVNVMTYIYMYVIALREGIICPWDTCAYYTPFCVHE